MILAYWDSALKALLIKKITKLAIENHWLFIDYWFFFSFRFNL